MSPSGQWRTSHFRSLTRMSIECWWKGGRDEAACWRTAPQWRGCDPGGDKSMTAADNLSTLVPSAKALMEKIALAEAEKCSEEMRRRASEEAEKKALIERLTKPSGLSDEQVMMKAAAIIDRAAKNGLTEVQVYRFPNSLCTDRGRAINQQEPGWETTLTGIPKEIYEFWDRRLRPLGYRLRVQVVDFSGGVPGDIGLSLKWCLMKRPAPRV